MIVVLVLVMLPRISSAADLSSYPNVEAPPDLEAAYGFIYDLFNRFEASKVNFKVSKPFELGALRDYLVEINFLMCEPEKITSLIDEMENFCESDTALRVTSVAILSSADVRQDGKIVTKVGMYAHFSHTPAADEVKRTFPNDALTSILTVAKFEPGVKNLRRQDDINIWLSKMIVIANKTSNWNFEFSGYVKNIDALKASTEGFSSNFSDVAFPTVNEVTYSKYPFIRFDGIASIVK